MGEMHDLSEDDIDAVLEGRTAAVPPDVATFVGGLRHAYAAEAVPQPTEALTELFARGLPGNEAAPTAEPPRGNRVFALISRLGTAAKAAVAAVLLVGASSGLAAADLLPQAVDDTVSNVVPFVASDSEDDDATADQGPGDAPGTEDEGDAADDNTDDNSGPGSDDSDDDDSGPSENSGPGSVNSGSGSSGDDDDGDTPTSTPTTIDDDDDDSTVTTIDDDDDSTVTTIDDEDDHTSTTIDDDSGSDDSDNSGSGSDSSGSGSDDD